MKTIRTREIAAPAVLVLTAWLGAGCSDKGTAPQIEEEEGGTTVSYAADIQPIFDRNCAGCHGAGGNGGLDLRAAFSHDNLVGIAAQGHPGLRVDAGDPDASVLYLKMSGAEGVGNSMPPGGVLSAATISLVREWILAGAPEN